MVVSLKEIERELLMYEFSGRIRYSECDENGYLGYGALINYLQDCCTFQSEDLKIGLPYLRAHHLGWFITDWDLKITRMPKMGDVITIATWPYRFRGFLGFRNFTVKDRQGEILVEADSLWILMDLENRRPMRLPEDMLEAFLLSEPLGSNEKRSKLHPAEDKEDTRSYIVSQAYLDSNHHMNNGYYVAEALADLPEEVKVRRIQVEYKKSARLGDVVFCSRTRTPEGWQMQQANEAGEIFALVVFSVVSDERSLPCN
jgi:acyl-ACP thioesterase